LPETSVKKTFDTGSNCTLQIKVKEIKNKTYQFHEFDSVSGVPQTRRYKNKAKNKIAQVREL